MIFKKDSSIELANATALCERMYVADGSDGIEMYGVLIYTTTTCSDGSLGGLVRMGEPERLSKCIDSLLNRAIWCSNDPICIEAENQGTDGLNYAACHACSLVPEVSCELSNLILDRCSIVGKYNERELGYFSELLV